MKLIKLTKQEEFEELKKGDLILVEWDDYTVKHNPAIDKKVMVYKIFEVKKPETHGYSEIICQKKGNQYFNYLRYIEGLSGALDVRKIEVSDES